MDNSILGILPQEIQRMIMFYALLNKGQANSQLPSNLVVLQICRHLNILGLDVLRRDFAWTEWTIYRCIGSSFMQPNPLRAFERGEDMLRSNGIGATPIVSFEVCRCPPHKKIHSTKHITSILAPFELLTFASSCTQVTKYFTHQDGTAHLTINNSDHGHRLDSVLQILELKLRRVYLRNAGEPTPAIRRLQSLVSTETIQHALILDFFRDSIDSAHIALKHRQPDETLRIFTKCKELFPQTEMIELLRGSTTITNTIRVLHAMLGIAALQAICQALLRKIRLPLRSLYLLRDDARRTAVLHMSTALKIRHSAYLWDIAALRLLMTKEEASADLRLLLLKTLCEDLQLAIDLWPEDEVREELFDLHVTLRQEHHVPPIALKSFRHEDDVWRGPLETFDLWDQPKGYVKSSWTNWQGVDQEIVRSIEVYETDDPVEVGLRASFLAD